MPISKQPLLLIWLLPAGLFAVTLALCGAFFESNDDAVLALLLRGETASAPVIDFLFYLHGLGHFLAGLYAQFPALPWYGLVLYAQLFAALVLSAFFLYRIRPESSAQVNGFGLLIAALFLAAWAEHIMWFSFVRVAILLAGAAVLAFLVTSGKKKNLLWYLLCAFALVLALCLRPRAAFLGIACALPAVYWLLPEGKQKGKWLATRVMPIALVLLLFQGFLLLKTSAQQKRNAAG